MTNFKKIGLTALAGSLAVTAYAQAGSLSVGGTARMEYQSTTTKNVTNDKKIVKKFENFYKAKNFKNYYDPKLLKEVTNIVENSKGTVADKVINSANKNEESKKKMRSINSAWDQIQKLKNT